MLRKLFLVTSTVLAFPGVTLADKPLAEVARPFGDKLAAGCVVTGEMVDGKVSYAVAGKAEPEGIPAERRVFEIGSITKVFTGLLLSQAVIDKKVRLDSTLKELLGPEVPFGDPQVGQITLLQLSTHTSGLPRLPDNIGQEADSQPDPYAEYDRKKMEAFLTKMKLKGHAPHEASYSNFGVGVLGELLADAYGTTWEALVREKITGPLGMKDTVVAPGDDQRRRLAPPYQGGKPGHEWTFKAVAAAGSLRSTAADLMIFGSAMVEPDKSPIADAIRGMMKAHAAYPDAGGEIGLGIMIGKLDGVADYMHTGGTGGYRSALQVIPAKKSVRVILINNDTVPAEALLRAVRDEKKAEAVPEVALSDKELDAFTGIYEISPGARFTVLRRGNALHVRLTGQPFFPVKSMGKDRFRYDVVAAELQFNREAASVGSVTLFQSGREMPAKRMEEPPPEIIFTTDAELAPYRGDYELGAGKILSVTTKGGTLCIQLTGQPALPAFQTKPGYFELDVVKAALEFQKEDDGKVTGLILHQNGSHPAKKR